MNDEYTPNIGRIPILSLSPKVEDGRWAAKAFEGEVIPFGATAFREGHDLIGVALVLQSPDGNTREHAMTIGAAGTDHWGVQVQLNQTGIWRFHVRAYSDDFASWLHDAMIKIPADIDADLTRSIGARLLADAASETERPATVSAVLQAAASALTKPGLDTEQTLAVLTDTRLIDAVSTSPVSHLESVSETHEIVVERRVAGNASWYEFFPRSEGAKRNADGTWKSGTFRSAAKRLPQISAMGFDVVYLPPIHPIGISFRKGPNNALTAQATDPGSPWAIGSAAGGHDSLHADLGTEKGFQFFVQQAQKNGLEVALDLALQASPDHPWVVEHPEWFTTLPDGTIAYAENPPKKYQDIFPLNFDNDSDGIRAEVLRIVELWILRGIRIFRVDNPHTKPIDFWEWLIHTVNATHSDIVFLAEAFTRPEVMNTLAKVGFQQSYTYFTWRNTKPELEEFITSISTGTPDFLRPNLFVNTPDILSEYLQFGGAPAFKIRAALAATIAPTWGVYSGFELYESVARTGAEEYIDNEKFEYKPRNFAAAEAEGLSLAPYLSMLNQTRRSHPALGQLRNLRLHTSQDDTVLVYSKHLDGAFTPSGASDTIIVVANLDPHSVRETTVHIDVRALGAPPGTPYTVTDLVTDQQWRWGANNYVRLDSFVEPIHILHVTEVQE